MFSKKLQFAAETFSSKNIMEAKIKLFSLDQGGQGFE